MRSHLVVHPEGGGLIDGDDHRLALKSPPEEVLNHILRDRLQPVVTGDEVILAPQLSFEALLLLLVEVG